MRSPFYFLVLVFLLVGCDQLRLTSPKTIGTAGDPTSQLYTVAGASDLSPGSTFVITFQGQAPPVTHTVRAAAGKTVSIVIAFVSGTGERFVCLNPTKSELQISCEVPSNLPEDTQLSVEVSMNEKPLKIQKEGGQFAMRTKKQGPPRMELRAPASSSTFLISSVVKSGTSQNVAKPGDHLTITGKGFLNHGPIQFHVGASKGDLAKCATRVESDTQASCQISGSTPIGNKVVWGEVVSDPMHQSGTVGQLSVQP